MRLFEVEESVYYNNWRLPNKKELDLEFYIKQQKTRYIEYFRNEYNANIFDSEENWHKAINQGVVKQLNLNEDYTIERRTFSSSMENLKNLVSTYAYPRDPDRIANGYKNDDVIPMPIILESQNGRKVIIAGNTRLDVARIMNIEPDPKVLVIPGTV